jgi:hypothetical protein
MTDVPSAPSILALHLGLLEAHAAVDRAGRIDLVALGGDRAGMPMVLHVSTGGDVAVGEDAIRRAVDDPDGFVDDVMGRLLDDGVVEASGRTLTAEAVLAHLMAQSYAACLRILDGAPEQVVVVRAAGGPDEATYEAAAGRGLVGDVRVLDETRAWSAFSGHAPPATRGMEPEHTGVLGALLWLRHGDAPTGPQPIVTREDIEGSAPEPLRQPSAPSVVSVGPRSVFDAPPSKPPDPSDPAPVRRRPRRTPVPLLVFLLIVVLAVLGYQRFLADEEPTTTEATTTTEVSTTTEATTTTEVSTTTEATTTTEVSTTTEATTTTEVSTTTEATTTTEVPTTTEPPPTTTRPPLGPVSISGQGLLLFAASDDSTFLELGGPVDTTLDAVSAVLGDPDRDSGWASDPGCAGSSVRRVGFGSLELVLVDRDPTDAPPAEDVPEGGDTEEGAETTTTVAPPGEPGFGAEFGRWFLSGTDSVDSGFWTLERIGVGSTVADVRLAYPDGFSVVQTDQADPAGFFDLDPIGLAGPISGATSNTTDEGRVLQLWAGSAC